MLLFEFIDLNMYWYWYCVKSLSVLFLFVCMLYGTWAFIHEKCYTIMLFNISIIYVFEYLYLKEI